MQRVSPITGVSHSVAREACAVDPENTDTCHLCIRFYRSFAVDLAMHWFTQIAITKLIGQIHEESLYRDGTK